MERYQSPTPPLGDLTSLETVVGGFGGLVCYPFMEFRDPALYRQLSVPFPSVDDANASIKAFCDELAELRKKHRIRDLLFTIRIGLVDEAGTEGDSTLVNHFGDRASMESMAAYTYGTMSARRQELMRAYVSNGSKAVRDVEPRD